MGIEKVIKQLESILDHACSMTASPDADNIWRKDIDALEFAISALRSTPQPGKPLTLDRLREMDGQPVWIERIEAPYDGKWFIVNYADTENPDKTLYTDSGVTYSEYGKYFIAYPYPPAHIDRSKWEPCAVCENETCRTCINAGMVSYGDPCCECDATASGGSYYEPSNFCPHCGRPLTEEAWTELERRVMR